MPSYEVSWSTNIEAESPVVAAAKVAKAWFKQDIATGAPSSPCTFQVEDKQGAQETVMLSAVMHELDPPQLRELFVHEHPTHSMLGWKDEVYNGETVLGYWEWVQHALEEQHHEDK